MSASWIQVTRNYDVTLRDEFNITDRVHSLYQELVDSLIVHVLIVILLHILFVWHQAGMISLNVECTYGSNDI